MEQDFGRRRRLDLPIRSAYLVFRSMAPARVADADVEAPPSSIEPAGPAPQPEGTHRATSGTNTDAGKKVGLAILVALAFVGGIIAIVVVVTTSGDSSSGTTSSGSGSTASGAPVAAASTPVVQKADGTYTRQVEYHTVSTTLLVSLDIPASQTKCDLPFEVLDSFCLAVDSTSVDGTALGGFSKCEASVKGCGRRELIGRVGPTTLEAGGRRGPTLDGGPRRRLEEDEDVDIFEDLNTMVGEAILEGNFNSREKKVADVEKHTQLAGTGPRGIPPRRLAEEIGATSSSSSTTRHQPRSPVGTYDLELSLKRALQMADAGATDDLQDLLDGGHLATLGSSDILAQKELSPTDQKYADMISSVAHNYKEFPNSPRKLAPTALELKLEIFYPTAAKASSAQAVFASTSAGVQSALKQQLKNHFVTALTEKAAFDPALLLNYVLHSFDDVVEPPVVEKETVVENTDEQGTVVETTTAPPSTTTTTAEPPEIKTRSPAGLAGETLTFAGWTGPARAILAEEVAVHNNTGSDCWVGILGKVFDVTKWNVVTQHPAGVALPCGVDATPHFLNNVYYSADNKKLSSSDFQTRLTALENLATSANAATPASFVFKGQPFSPKLTAKIEFSMSTSETFSIQPHKPPPTGIALMGSTSYTAVKKKALAQTLLEASRKWLGRGGTWVVDQRVRTGAKLAIIFEFSHNNNLYISTYPNTTTTSPHR